jgi:heat shock protein HtpX
MTPAGAPCPHCGYENRPGELTCNLCGAVLAHETKAAPLPTTAPMGQRGQLFSSQREREEEAGPEDLSRGAPKAGADVASVPSREGATQAPTIDSRRDFFAQIAANKRRSVLLLALVTGLLLILGAAIGEATEPQGWPIGLGFAVLAAVMIGLVSYFQGSAIVLAASRARPVAREEAPQLHNIVEEMAIAAGLPAPAVYLIEDTAPNAFATGRDPQHAAITVTRGLLDKLNRDELQGVIGHEMSHIRNFDIRYSMLVAILVGSIVLFCDMFMRSMFYRRTGRDRREGAWPFVLLALLLAIIAPIFATLLQMAISRQREYLADASSVQLTRNPLGLADALAKIAGDPEPLEEANRATQHLYIVNPLKVFGINASALMSTHPPTEARIKILRSMT